MTNLEKVKLYLVKGGFDKTSVLTLPKLFMQEYLEKDYDKLSELLDVFIDYVYKSNRYSNDYANFGNVSSIKEDVYQDFKNSIIENFRSFITRQPLNSVLVAGGYDENMVQDNIFFNQSIVDGEEQYSDLICIKPYFDILDNSNNATYYITMNDLHNLLLSKGINEEDIKIVMNSDKNGLYINSDAIKNLGVICKQDQTNLKR